MAKETPNPELEEEEVIDGTPTDTDPPEPKSVETPNEPEPTPKSEPMVVDFDGTEAEFIEAVGIDMNSDEVIDALNSNPEMNLQDLVEKFGDKEKLAAFQKSADPDPEPKAPEPKPEKPEGKSKKIRVHLEDDDDLAISAIQKAKGISWSKAAKLYFAEEGNKPESPAKPTEPPADRKDEPAPKPVETVSPWDAKITEYSDKEKELEEKISKAEEDLEFGEANKLTRELTQIQIAKARAEDAKDRDAERTQQAYESEKGKSEAAVVEKYPNIGKPGTLENSAFTNFYNERYKEDPSAFEDPNWPMTLADEFAEKYGLQTQSPADGEDGKKPSPSKQPAPAQTQARRTPTSRSSMLDGGNGGPTTPPPANESTMSDEEIDKILTDMAKGTPAERKEAERIYYKAMGFTEKG